MTDGNKSVRNKLTCGCECYVFHQTKEGRLLSIRTYEYNLHYGVVFRLRRGTSWMMAHSSLFKTRLFGPSLFLPCVPHVSSSLLLLTPKSKNCVFFAPIYVSSPSNLLHGDHLNVSTSPIVSFFPSLGTRSPSLLPFRPDRSPFPKGRAVPL